MTSLASVYVSDIDVGIILSHESVDFLLNCIVVVTSRLQLLLSGISISPLTCEDFLGHGSHAFFVELPPLARRLTSACTAA